MPTVSQIKLQEALSQISAVASSADLAAADETFRAAFLAFASATPDNLACLESIAVTPFRTEAFTSWAGLASRGIPVGSVLNAAEGCSVPESVLADFPALQQADWDAVLRVAVVILAAFHAPATSVHPSAA